METKFIKLGGVVVLLLAVSACVIAPQSEGYRMTSAVLPTYVNGQYIGMQSSSYVAPAQTLTTADTNSSLTVVQQNPVYVQSPLSSVIYVQTPAPVYTYNPYYAPVHPWYGVGAGMGIGINYFGRCCWRDGWRGGGWRGGHRHR